MLCCRAAYCCCASWSALENWATRGSSALIFASISWASAARLTRVDSPPIRSTRTPPDLAPALRARTVWSRLRNWFKVAECRARSDWIASIPASWASHILCIRAYSRARAPGSRDEGVGAMACGDWALAAGSGDVRAPTPSDGSDGDSAGSLKGLAGRSAGMGSTVSFAASERSFGLSQPVGTRTIQGRIANVTIRRELPVFALILMSFDFVVSYAAERWQGYPVSRVLSGKSELITLSASCTL